jgi:hypothetical protein
VPARQRSPRWTDEKAVAEFVAKEIAQDELNELYRLEKYKVRDIKLPKGWRDAPMRVSVAQRRWVGEQEAVEAAMRGDVEPLANLLRPFAGVFGLPDEVNPAIKQLSPATWAIIVQFLTGERKLRTGRLGGGPGRPTMSLEERRAESPVHDAAEEVDAIRAILRRSYPDQHSRQIRERAMEIAAQRKGVELDTLVNYLKRPKKDRRRLTT